jgi:hypothetical protein
MALQVLFRIGASGVSTPEGGYPGPAPWLVAAPGAAAVEEAPRRGGAFYPTRAEIARAKRRARNTGGFVMPLSRIRAEERRETIEELQEEVQDAIAEVSALVGLVDEPIPAVPSINWEAIEKQREFEATTKRLNAILQKLDYMIEMAQDDDDMEVLLLS